MKKTSDKTGIALIELMVVMAVAAVLISIAAVNYMRLLPGIRLSGATRQIMCDLMAARMASVKENSNASISCLSGSSYSVRIGNGALNTKNLEADFPDVKISFPSITFYARGNATARTITLENSSGRKTVTINFTGRVRTN